MLAFKETLLHCELMDLRFHGYLFTWWNGRLSVAFVELRLDRACANTVWQALFPTTKVFHQQVTYFDHDPMLRNTQSSSFGHDVSSFLDLRKDRWLMKGVRKKSGKHGPSTCLMAALCLGCLRRLSFVKCSWLLGAERSFETQYISWTKNRMY